MKCSTLRHVTAIVLLVSTLSMEFVEHAGEDISMMNYNRVALASILAVSTSTSSMASASACLDSSSFKISAKDALKIRPMHPPMMPAAAAKTTH